jgi:cell division protein FtsB
MAERSEAVELRDKIWTYTQRLVVLLVAMFVGLFVGYQLWGQASQLQDEVVELSDKLGALVKERDTLKSRLALLDRDKKEVERRLQDLQARTGTPEETGPGGVIIE